MLSLSVKGAETFDQRRPAEECKALVHGQPEREDGFPGCNAGCQIPLSEFLSKGAEKNMKREFRFTWQATGNPEESAFETPSRYRGILGDGMIA